MSQLLHALLPGVAFGFSSLGSSPERIPFEQSDPAHHRELMHFEHPIVECCANYTVSLWGVEGSYSRDASGVWKDEKTGRKLYWSGSHWHTASHKWPVGALSPRGKNNCNS